MHVCRVAQPGSCAFKPKRKAKAEKKEPEQFEKKINLS
jgi:hypothetical protein